MGGTYVWIHVTPRQIHHSLSAFSAKGAKTDFSSVHRLAVELELLPCFTFFVQPATEIFLNMLSNTHFVYQREDNKKRKRRKQEGKKVASSRRLWFPAGHLYCFQPSPTGFNLDGIPSFENRALRRGVTRSATPSFARGCETRICNSINNLILNVTISRPMKTYSPGKTYFFLLLRRLFIGINLRTRLTRSSISDETSSTFAFFIFAERIWWTVRILKTFSASMFSNWKTKKTTILVEKTHHE